MDPRLDATLRELGVPQYVERAREATLARAIAFEEAEDTAQPNPDRLPRLAFVYESQAVAAYQRARTSGGPADAEEARAYFRQAFECWRAIASLPDATFGTPLAADVSRVGSDLVASELRGEPLPPNLTLAFRLAVSGFAGERTAETRLELLRFRAEDDPELEWRDRVARGVFWAFVLLVRKKNGWEDIDSALALIDSLRGLQQQHEEAYLNRRTDEADQVAAAVELVGLYHAAQIVTSTGTYLRDGQPAFAGLAGRLDRHREQAVEAFRRGGGSLLAHLVDLLWLGCRELAQNAIWTHVTTIGQAAQRLARLLADRGRPNPVIELWPSQQDAFRRNFLDPYQRAILVEMPTSAGKTLLAKFAIVQTRALNPDATVAYIVPTRALVNQVVLDLRGDFRQLDIRVEQAVPAYELDPTEDRLLRSRPGVLVTTPEKLDLLVRSDHPAVADLSLVVADEAHNLADRGRGAP